MSIAKDIGMAKAEAPVPILIVDDQDLVRDLLYRALTSWGYSVQEASDGYEALKKIQNNKYEIVLSDLQMPGLGGKALLEKVIEMDNPPLMIIITGQNDINDAIDCLTGGAYDFLLKPIDLQYLKNKIEAANLFRRLKLEEERKKEMLEEVALAERRKSQQVFLDAIDALIRALEAKDTYTEGHSIRVAALAEGMAIHANLRSQEISNILTAARCHDIGKIGVSDAVLQKPGRLTDEEFEIIKSHPAKGARILRPIFKDYPEIVASVHHHHEKWNGRGYPDGLESKEIPLGARIIGIADAYDAMTSNRVYRGAKKSKEAVDEIIRNVGIQFCPQATKAFIQFYKRHFSNMDDNAWKDRRLEERFDIEEPAILETEGKRQQVLITEVSESGLRIQSGTLNQEFPSRIRLVLMNESVIEGKMIWNKINDDEPEKAHQLLGFELTGKDEAFEKIIETSLTQFSERRNYDRIHQVLPIAILDEYGNDISWSETTPQSILNINMIGAFIQCRNPFSIGKEFEVLFWTPDNPTNPFRVSVRVTHRLTMIEALQEKGAIPGMGVQFLEFKGDTQKRLESYVQGQLDSRTTRAIFQPDENDGEDE